MAGSRAKLAYAARLSVEELIRVSKRPTFDTFTFRENILSKADAEVCWRRLKEWLRRKYPALKAIGVWQRQKRGCWHIHVVFDRPLDVTEVRKKAMECGFGPMLNMRYVGLVDGFRGWSAAKVANYITRYITRDLEEGDKGVRVVEYMGDSRKCTVRFGWAKGLARLWRYGRQVWSDIYGVERPSWENYWFVIRLGWEACGEEERSALLQQCDGVARWHDPERYPF